ncbi:hypothetical protein BDR26DRAFT_202893 [Obelidium mucronatum]|nr:hypothetical protein BDR26DRAFT_202893 [Obelidium mucronatum]
MFQIRPNITSEDEISGIVSIIFTVAFVILEVYLINFIVTRELILQHTPVTISSVFAANKINLIMHCAVFCIIWLCALVAASILAYNPREQQKSPLFIFPTLFFALIEYLYLQLCWLRASDIVRRISKTMHKYIVFMLKTAPFICSLCYELLSILVYFSTSITISNFGPKSYVAILKTFLLILFSSISVLL